MKRSAKADRGNRNYQWQQVATVPRLPDGIATWPLGEWHDFGVEFTGAAVIVEVALQTPLSGSPGSCLITIWDRHEEDRYFGPQHKLIINTDGTSAVIERHIRIWVPRAGR